MLAALSSLSRQVDILFSALMMAAFVVICFVRVRCACCAVCTALCQGVGLLLASQEL